MRLHKLPAKPMSTLRVELGPRSYPIVVEDGLLNRAADHVMQAGRWSSVAVLTHPHLVTRYAEPLMASLRSKGVRVTLVTLPAGERTKTLRGVARVYDALIQAGMDRRGLLITLGGGVLGDLGGFAAATYLRGVAFIQAPTTLLAQVDASVGGKTGVDLPQGKNLVGAFYQPQTVLVDTATLRTLPMRELRAGAAEVIKYGIIRDKSLFARLQAEMPLLLRRTPGVLDEIILRSCEIKADVVAADETEQGLRAILNFGHTVGHALEAATSYRKYRHGEAVAIGMVSACLIGEEMGVTPPAVTRDLSDLIRRSGLPTALPAGVPLEAILTAAGRDKKVQEGRLHFILARDIGDVFVTGDVPQQAVRAALSRQEREA